MIIIGPVKIFGKSWIAYPKKTKFDRLIFTFSIYYEEEADPTGLLLPLVKIWKNPTNNKLIRYVSFYYNYKIKVTRFKREISDKQLDKNTIINLKIKEEAGMVNPIEIDVLSRPERYAQIKRKKKVKNG